MKRVRIQSVEDLEALPEDEWVEVVGGMKFRWAKEPMHVEGRKLVVPLPAGVRRQFRPKKGEVLRARLSNGDLIVERPATRRTKLASR
jgi:hypothetical protein